VIAVLPREPRIKIHSSLHFSGGPFSLSRRA
jgi:hypothetical protein